MAGRTTSFASLLCVLGCVVPASAAASNSSATQAYVNANYALVRVAHGHLATAEAAPKTILQRVTRECPQAARNSPQNVLSEHLSNEVIGVMVLEAAKPDAAALHRFLRTVTPLRWASSSLNHTMHAYITSLTKLSKLSVPNICQDIAAWVATHYETLPATTVSFDNAFVPNWVAFGYLPRVIARFESAGARSIAKRSEKLEGDLIDAESRAVYDWADILDELILNP